MKINHADASALPEYAVHLKNLSVADKYTRFCYTVRDESIDQLILLMLYNQHNHHLFTAVVDDQTVGFGHLAREGEDWELAVSVDAAHQGHGHASGLMEHMLLWGKTHGIVGVFMHCISQNTKIQHLARKHGLRMVQRDGAEMTSRVELPQPTLKDYTEEFIREQKDLLTQMSAIQQRLWSNLNPLTYIKETSRDQ